MSHILVQSNVLENKTIFILTSSCHFRKCLRGMHMCRRYWSKLLLARGGFAHFLLTSTCKIRIFIKCIQKTDSVSRSFEKIKIAIPL